MRKKFKPIGVIKTEKDYKQLLTWIDVLRSGEYTQGRGVLESRDGNKGPRFCCLGVACKVLIPPEDLAVHKTGKLHGGTPGDQPAAPQWLTNINHDVVEMQLVDRYESTSFEPVCLIHMNDSKGSTFDEVADMLEAIYVHRVLS